MWAVLVALAAGDAPASQLGLGPAKFLTFMGDQNPHVGRVDLERETYGGESACFTLQPDDDIGDFSSAVDYKCMGWGSLDSAKCQSGMPFYRVRSNAMTENTCLLFCVFRGFDLAGIVKAQECRCGATAENTAVWGAASPPVKLLPPVVEARVSPTSNLCQMVILQHKLENGAIAADLLDESEVDSDYRASIVTGQLVKPDSDDALPTVQGDTTNLFVWSANGAGAGVPSFDDAAANEVQDIEDVIAGGASGATALLQAKRLAARKDRANKRRKAKKQHQPAHPALKRSKADGEAVLDKLRAKAVERAERLGYAPHPEHVQLLAKKAHSIQDAAATVEAAASAEWKDWKPWLHGAAAAAVQEGEALAAAGRADAAAAETHLRAAAQTAEQAVERALAQLLDVTTLRKKGREREVEHNGAGSTCGDRAPDVMEPPLRIGASTSKATCAELNDAGHCDVVLVQENCPVTCHTCPPEPFMDRHCGDDGCTAATLWPRDSASTGGYVVVNYKFSTAADENGNPLIDEARKQAFLAAANDIEAKTCLRFGDSTKDPRFNGVAGTTPGYIDVTVEDLDRCSTTGSGYPGFGKGRVLNMGRCSTVLDLGSVVHQLVHSLGGMHENQRPDAQTELGGKGPFIKVAWSNVENSWKESYTALPFGYTGSAENGFHPYNYESVMHPAATAGAVDGAQPTFETLPTATVNGEEVGIFDAAIGQRKGMSVGDAQAINQMYGCGQENVLMQFHNQFYQSACNNALDAEHDRGTCAGYRQHYAMVESGKEACDLVFCPLCPETTLEDGTKLGPGMCNLECNHCPSEPPQGEILAGLAQMLAKAATDMLPSVEYVRDLAPIADILHNVSEVSLLIAQLPVKDVPFMT